MSQVSYGTERVTTKHVIYTGTDTLQEGDAVCYDRNAGTAADDESNRYSTVEKPSVSNLANFAGFVDGGFAGLTGTGRSQIMIQVPNGGMLNIKTNANAVLDTTFLAIQAGSYIVSAVGAGGVGQIVALAGQTVDRSSTDGLVLAECFPIQGVSAKISGTAAGRGLSPLIWDTCPYERIKANPQLGVTFDDDFYGIPSIFGIIDLTDNSGGSANDVIADITDAVTTNSADRAPVEDGFADVAAKILEIMQGAGPYKIYKDIGVVANGLADDIGGVLAITGNDADNDEFNMQVGGTAGVMMNIAANKDFWFECRIKKASIADNGLGFAIGLGEEGLAAADFLADASAAFPDKDFIGFHCDQANGDAIDSLVSTGGGSRAIIEAGFAVPVADTYLKLGIAQHASLITFFLNGVASTTTTTVTTAQVPDGQEMTLTLGTKVGTASAVEFVLDWWRFAQLF